MQSKSILPYALGLFACSGETDLLPTDPEPPPATMPPPAPPPPPAKMPSIAIVSPADGDVFGTNRIQVRGAAIDLAEVVIGGARIPVAAGEFVHEVVAPGEGPYPIAVSGEGAAEAQVDVTIDLSPPEIEILTPSRGAFVDASLQSRILVQGRVTDAFSEVESVLVNGAPVPIVGGAFSTDFAPDRGVNVIEVVAADRFGHAADVLQGAIYGDFAPWDEPLPDALSIRLGAAVFDQLEAQLEAGILTSLSTAAPSNNPSFTIDDIRVAAVDVEVLPRTGFLDLSVALSELEVDFTVNTVILGTPVSASGLIAADAVLIATEAHLGIDASGQIYALTEDSTASLTNLTFTLGGVAPILTNALAAIITPQLEQGLIDALEGQDFSSLFDLDALLPEGVDAAVTGLDVSPTGLAVILDAGVSLPPDPSVPPAPGILFLAGAVPSAPPSSHDVAMSVSDDLTNGILFNTWRSGALTASIASPPPGQGMSIALDAATFALFFGDDLFDYAPPETLVGVHLRPLLPPVARFDEGASPIIHVTLADALVDFTLEPDGEEPIRFATFAAILDVTMRLEVDEGAIVPSASIAARIDLTEAPLFPIDEAALEGLLTALLTGAQAGEGIGQGAVPSLPSGLSNLALDVEGDYLSILGDL
jgi:hypothetical protein